MKIILILYVLVHKNTDDFKHKILEIINLKLTSLCLNIYLQQMFYQFYLTLSTDEICYLLGDLFEHKNLDESER